MADEPDLPTIETLPRLPFDIAERWMAQNPHKRVRRSPPVSSDPPTFSSDDDPDADNYVQCRYKRTYQGPWYQQRTTSDGNAAFGDLIRNANLQNGGKRSLQRHFDSGVFMASDGTEPDEGEDEFSLPEKPSEQFIEQQSVPYRSSQQFILPSLQGLVDKHIMECLETGDEMINLSSRYLEHLSNASIRPLASFIRIPTGTSDVYTPLEPRLRIFLANNVLKTLPGELFNLHHLTELSLRNNKIYDLPPRIGNVKSLLTLNLAGNRFRHLPYEILELFCNGSSLVECLFHPNPFYQPQYPDCPSSDETKTRPYKIGLGCRTPPRRVLSVSPDQHRRRWSPHWKTQYRGRTEVRYFDINGTLLKGPFDEDPGASLGIYSLPVADENDIPTPPVPRGGSIVSRVPSLLEVCLQACSQSTLLPELGSYLPRDSPEYLLSLLSKTAEKRESGGSTCTICKRKFIVKRTEWIEWWEIRKVVKEIREVEGVLLSAASPLGMLENERDVLERCVPLVRRGCSWACGPETLMRSEEAGGGRGRAGTSGE